jgi:hypothetical protein
MALLGAAGFMGVTQATHAAAQSGCTVLYQDPSEDAPDNSSGVTVGPQQPNLDITQGEFCLSADGSTLRAILTLENQDFAFSTTGPGIDYQMTFAFGTNTSGQPNLYATDASLTNNPSGGPVEKVTFGTFQPISTSQTGLLFTQYVPNPADTVLGSFGSGPNATVEVDVPLADITTGGSAPPHAGDTLTLTQGFTASGTGNQGAGNEFFSDVDPSTTTFGANYTIPSPAATTPEVPVTPMLLASGALVAAAAAIWRRRRHVVTSRS